MIKFFRRIRFNLIKNAKTLNYIKYTVGEIVLVVLGILIALQINNWNQQAKNQKKIEFIFQEILNDLSNDIAEVNHLIEYYVVKDTLTSRVLRNEITASDYDGRSPYLFLILNRRTTTFDVNGFENLMLNIDKVPKKYDSLVVQLKLLYSRDRIRVEEFQLTLSVLIDRTIDKYANHYDWFSQSEERHLMERIDYQLHDPKYKNEVKRYRIMAVENLLVLLRRFRIDAIHSYRALHDVVRPGEELPEFISDMPDQSENISQTTAK